MRDALGSIQGVISRMRKRGVVFRSREERLQEILEYVRREYPEARMEDLVDDINGLSLPILQEEWCRNCKPSRCPTGGKLWFIERYEGESGLRYFPWFQMCGKWKAWKFNQASERDGKKPEPVRGFLGGGFRERGDD